MILIISSDHDPYDANDDNCHDDYDDSKDGNDVNSNCFDSQAWIREFVTLGSEDGSGWEAGSGDGSGSGDEPWDE